MPAIGIAAKKHIRKPKAARQRQHDVGIGARRPDRRDDRWPQLHPPHPAQVRIEPGAQALALPGCRSGENDVGIAGGRVDEEIGVHVKLQAAQRTLRSCRIRVRAQEVGAKGKEHPHRVRLALDHGAIDIARRYPSVERGPKRAGGEPKRFCPLLRGNEVQSGDVAEARSRIGNVAAARAIAAGQGIEQRDRPAGLRRGDALRDAVPDIIGNRRSRLQDRSGFAQSCLRDSGDLGHLRRRIFRGRRGVDIERGTARHKRIG